MSGLKQTSAPLYEGLRRHIERKPSSFHIPAHGGKAVPEELCSWEIFAYDLTELPSLDDLHAPTGIIAEAQALAAACFGAQHTFFLVNGSTSGIIAAIMATCSEGEKIILPRNAHRAVMAGLIHSGARPVYVPVEVLDGDFPLNVTVSALEEAVVRHPESRAILVTSPNYEGVAVDLHGIRELASRQEMFLIVDEAHGAHFSFHPHFPTGAAHCRADIWVQSAHKTLGALTPGAYLHLGNKPSPEEVLFVLQQLQTSSPSYPLMLSLDLVRRDWALRGRQRLDSLLPLVEEAREKLGSVSGLKLFDEGMLPPDAGFALDPLRLTIFGEGFALARYLRHQGIDVEMETLNSILCIISPWATKEDLDRLVRGVANAFKKFGCKQASKGMPAVDDRGLFAALPIPPLQLTPRQAFYSPSVRVPLQEAREKIAKEAVIPFPPGIPILLPGEVVTADIVAAIEEAIARGLHLQGAPGINSGKICVLKES
ncbi:MAG: aminotransferase class I/II-fold pyridoxal phosphate-dependent enzyme [Dethiobacteria bacterium]|jgi:arginine decarboxylase|nr:aminotransferase class I/II-fold pyridoxal phosphate-dependent enzyme [Bacillota bacterium]